VTKLLDRLANAGRFAGLQAAIPKNQEEPC